MPGAACLQRLGSPPACQQPPREGYPQGECERGWQKTDDIIDGGARAQCTLCPRPHWPSHVSLNSKTSRRQHHFQLSIGKCPRFSISFRPFSSSFEPVFVESILSFDHLISLDITVAAGLQFFLTGAVWLPTINLPFRLSVCRSHHHSPSTHHKKQWRQSSSSVPRRC